MSATFRLDPEGDDALLHQIADRFANLGEEMAGAISQLAPRNTGRYARSIQSTTFIENGIYSGQPIRGTGVQSKFQVWVVVYTTSKLGHLLELGTKGRTVVAKNARGLMVWAADKYGPGGMARVVHQPAMARRPHFWPGFASTLGRLGSILSPGSTAKRVRVNARIV